jgi:hypothetical protein
VVALLGAGIVMAAFAAAVVYGPHYFDHVTEDALRPVGVMLLPPGNDPRGVMVAVTWTEQGWCSGQFHAQATETSTEVRLGAVVSRLHSAGVCAGMGTACHMAWADLTLKSPLGTRIVVRASDGAVLPVQAANSGPGCPFSSPFGMDPRLQV